MIDLPGLWREHQHAAFPAGALRFVAVDARLGALLTASLRSDGLTRALPPDKVEALKTALNQAVDVLKGELDVESRAYFERLVTLARAVAGGPGAGPPALV